ncbi:MAG: hypothetical protein MUC96_15315 [Myxococcaceae bacterium]|nr:hypothetical protein [Myxococcaceae bacterium]
MSTPLELAWQAVTAAPDDARCVDVLADLLLERGEPLGTHFRSVLGLLARPDDVALRLEVLRLQRAFEERYPGHALTWTRTGLLESVRYTRREGGALRSILAEPLACALRLVRWWSFDDERELRALDSLPASLVDLDVSLSTEREEPVALGAAIATLPRLEALSAQGQFSLEGLQHEGLRALTWSAFVRPGDEVVRELASVRLPALRGLTLGLRAGPAPWPLELLSGHAFPSLRSLSLAGNLWPNQLEELAACGLLRQLEELHLGVEPLPDFARILEEAADRFDHLERFTPPRPF